MTYTILSLHPFYEFGGIISLTTFFICKQTTLILELLSEHTLFISNVIAEEGTIDFECVVWNVLNQSFDLYVLVGLIRERTALRFSAEDWKLFSLVGELTIGGLFNIMMSSVRLQAGAETTMTTGKPISDELFF